MIFRRGGFPFLMGLLERCLTDFQLRFHTIHSQSEEDRSRSLESVKQLHDEYRPTKHHLDLLRQSIGLEPTPDLHDEGIKLTPGGNRFVINDR